MKTKKLHQSLFLGLGILLVAGMSSCGSAEKAVTTKAQGEELIEVYCTGPDYQSDKNTFRASAIGESLDQMVSKKKAGTNARAELATLIQSTIKGTIDNYVNSTELNNVEQVEERFEGLTREVINQQLNNIKVICEKQTRTGENKYKTYIALEMNSKDLEEAINQKLSQDEKLKVDYDYEKFKETFNAEMQKLEAQQGGF
jgi:predicted transposase YbfD/YdcC